MLQICVAYTSMTRVSSFKNGRNEKIMSLKKCWHGHVRDNIRHKNTPYKYQSQFHCQMVYSFTFILHAYCENVINFHDPCWEVIPSNQESFFLRNAKALTSPNHVIKFLNLNIVILFLRGMGCLIVLYAIWNNPLMSCPLYYMISIED